MDKIKIICPTEKDKKDILLMLSHSSICTLDTFSCRGTDSCVDCFFRKY